MNRLIAAATLAVLASPAAALAASWKIDPGHTSSTFEATHLLLTKVRGSIGETTGTVDIDDKDVTKSKIDVVIDATKLDTGSADRDAHLKTEDFFWTDKHPKITFVSTKVEKAGKDKLKVTGDLTMRGVTKPVVLDVTYTGTEVKAPWGVAIRGASAVTTVNRKDWGIVWNKTLDGGGTIVGDNVKLLLDVELHRPLEEKAKTN